MKYRQNNIRKLHAAISAQREAPPSRQSTLVLDTPFVRLSSAYDLLKIGMA